MSDEVVETAQVGTCKLCGQVMIKTRKPGESIDAWHPHDVKKACPPEPTGDDAWDADRADGWVAFYAAGKQCGRPGVENFIPGDKPPYEITRTKSS